MDQQNQRQFDYFTKVNRFFKDHQIRAKIQHKIRHYPRCFIRSQFSSSKRSKSVPDFRRLHQKFQQGLNDATSHIALTIVQPFNFQSSHQHYCWVRFIFKNFAKSVSNKSFKKVVVLKILSYCKFTEFSRKVHKMKFFQYFILSNIYDKKVELEKCQKSFRNPNKSLAYLKESYVISVSKTYKLRV